MELQKLTQWVLVLSGILGHLWCKPGHISFQKTINIIL